MTFLEFAAHLIMDPAFMAGVGLLFFFIVFNPIHRNRP